MPTVRSLSDQPMALPAGPSAVFAPPTESLGRYIVERLHGLGVRHAFGIPGDYVLGLFKLFEESPIALVGNTNELCAGYAADAYARINGLGVALVTYAVGGFSLANAVACAYAEKSPVVVISGAPGLRERKRDMLLHHTVGGYETQRDVFARLTVANAVLDDPLTAFREVDRVLEACLRHRRPVYLEVPRDRVAMPPAHPHVPLAETAASDPQELAAAVNAAAAMLRQSKRPVLLAGIEVHRFGLQTDLMNLAESRRIPVATMLLSKSAVRETHPLYAGVYQAAMSRQEVTRFVEESDCLLMLGTILTDVDTGIFTHNLDESRLVVANSEQVRVRRNVFQDVLLGDFVRALRDADLPAFDNPPPARPEPFAGDWKPDADAPVTVKRLFQKLNAILDRDTMVLADPGDALFAAADLTVHQDAEFLASSFYATLGWAVPAAIGAQCARPDRRPIVLVGDGAFQMTCTELGTTRRGALNPVVIVLNNKGYLTERFLLEGKFNDVPDWNYHKLPEFLGAGRGWEVRTEGELEAALTAALADKTRFGILNVHLDPGDTSPGLRRLAEALSRRV